MTKEELETAIKEADRLYYTTGDSAYSDLQYDKLKEALREMDPDNPLLSSLGQETVDPSRKVKHDKRMLSLEKVHEKVSAYTQEEDPFGYARFDDLFTWICKMPGANYDVYKEVYTKTENHMQAMTSCLERMDVGYHVSVEPKVDGCSAEALYIKGKLVHVSTRGNGDYGEDITANVKHLFPHELKLDSRTCLSDKFAIRGELYISKNSFAAINEKVEKEGGEAFCNARSLCSGTVNSIYSPYKNYLSFVMHDYVELTTPRTCFKSTYTRMWEMKKYGLDVISDYDCWEHSSMLKVYDSITKIEADRDKFPFVIDGAVIKICDLKTREELGETDHHPRWAVAFKYLPECKETTLKKVIWQIGAKTGKAAPVGEVEPVVLDGTVVSRVSLANAGLMAHRGIWEGCKIKIEKSGEVIPYVREVVDPKDIVLEDSMSCPSCGKDMTLVRGKKDHTADYVCSNPACNAKIAAGLVAAFGTNGLNVLGFGPETADLFIEGYPQWDGSSLQARILNIVFLDRIDYVDDLNGKTGNNLYNEMITARTAPLHRWLAGLCIEGMAMGSAKRIAKKCKDFSEVKHMLATGALDDCVSSKAKANLKDALDIVDATLEDLRVTNFNPMSEHYTEDTGSIGDKLSGLAFVVTGTFRTGPRDVVEKMITDNGGVVRGSVSKKTNYLVAGEDVGATKMNKAAACGTKIISEAEFLQMLN